MANYRKIGFVAALVFSLGGFVRGAGQDGLIGWWRFDGATGPSLEDRSGQQKTAAVIVGNPERVEGKTGAGLKFDGVDDYVDLPEIAKNRNFTIEILAWINPTEQSGYQAIVATRDGWIFYGPDTSSPVPGVGRLFLGIHADRNGGADTVGATSYNWIFPIAGIEGKWVRFVFTGADDNEARLYINGRRMDIGQRKTDGGMTGDYFTSIGAFTGKNSSGADTIGRYLSGMVGEVKIYSRALSEEEAKDGSKPK